MIEEQLKTEILARGQSDYTGLWELPTVLRHIAPDLSQTLIKECIFEAVRSLASEGLIEIGDLVRVSVDEPIVEFVTWPVSVDHAMKRIKAEWESLDGQLDMGSIAWLLNTASGNFVAQGYGIDEVQE